MFALFYLMLVLGIVGATIIAIALVRKKPLGRVVAVSMRSRKLWNRAEFLAVVLIVAAFAVLFIVNNRLRPPAP